MIKRLVGVAVAVFALGASQAMASSITLSATPVVSGAFDIVVSADGVFDARDETTDFLLSYGFDLVLDPSLVSFLGATSSAFFDAPSSVPDTDVFAAASGFGLFPPVAGPLTLATLHFEVLAAGPIVISLTTDPSSPFQGLQFFNDPFQEAITGRITVGETAAVPEPATLLLLGSGVAGGVLRRRRRSTPAVV